MLIAATLGVAVLLGVDLPSFGHDKERVTITISWQDTRSDVLVTIYANAKQVYNEHYRGSPPFIKSYIVDRGTPFSVSAYQYEAGYIQCHFTVDGVDQEPFSSWDKGMLRCRRRY